MGSSGSDRKGYVSASGPAAAHTRSMLECSSSISPCGNKENELQRLFFRLSKMEGWDEGFPNENCRKHGDFLLLLLLSALKSSIKCVNV